LVRGTNFHHTLPQQKAEREWISQSPTPDISVGDNFT
jgi:hypothetical protein